MPPSRPTHRRRPLRSVLRPVLPLAAALCACPLQAGPIELPGINPADDAFLLWDRLVTLRAAAGYKDNALLSGFVPQDTPLAIAGVEYYLTRLPVDGHGFTAFLSADLRRYLEPADVEGFDSAHGETLVLGQLNYKFYGRLCVPAIAVTYVHAEQVFDATDLGGTPGAVRANGDAFIVDPSLRFNLTRQWYVQAQYVASRQIFKAPVSSYWEHGPKATLGWQPHTNTLFEVSWQYTDRPFDNRQQTDPLGTPLSGTRLTTYDHRYEASWRQTWYSPWKLQTTVRAFTLSRLENGEGFSDYDRVGGSVNARLELGKWAFRGLARWSTFDFALQIVSVLDPVPRTREETEFEARVEYRWTPRFRTYAEYLHERQRSNVQADHYHANTWQAGVEFDF